MKKKGLEGRSKWYLLYLSIYLAFLAGVVFAVMNQESKVVMLNDTEYTPDTAMPEAIAEMRREKGYKPLHEVYKDLRIVDVHSHSVHDLHRSETHDMSHVTIGKDVWEKYGIDKTVLFGDVSAPSAVRTDRLAWRYYREYPDLIYPSFSGFPLEKGENGMDRVKENLEKGYLAVGEVYAASTYSPSADVLWKGQHPYWGILPDIYPLLASYRTPILLHIDPPEGININYLKTALRKNPETIFIFAHANVFNSPENLERLLAEFDNLYIDFFAGFTKYNSNSSHSLEDFVPLIEKYPDQFFLGSDSGVEIGIEKAYRAMYELIDRLSPETAAKVAFQNYERLIEEQPATELQKQTIRELAAELSLEGKTYRLNKRKANELIFSLQDQRSSP